ncbi:MAG: lipopolysaccharide heptosyltransferase II [Pseudomonadota bacterium]
MAYAGVNKTLLVASAWVGDMVMSHTLVQRLAQAQPQVQIDVLAPAATAPLAQRMAEVKHTHVLHVGHGELGLTRRWRIARQIRSAGYRAAYVLPNTWKSALVPWLAGIPQRSGWLGEMRYGLLNDYRRLEAGNYPLMIERFMALADPAGNLPPPPYPDPRLEVDADNLSKLCGQLGLSTTPRITALCPGAEFGAAKKWPARHYAALAQRLLDGGDQVWLLGSPNDKDDCARIAELAPGVVDLAGRTSLLDAIDLLSLADQAVCNDSGLMHIACALQVPTVGIFGSTSPAFTPPLGPLARVAEIELDCRPCFQRECPLGHLNCLHQLTPDDVAGRLQP